MLSYYIIWNNSLTEYDSIPIPLLFPIKKHLTQGVAFQYSDVDLVCGLAHELWKPPEYIEAPKDKLLSVYTRLVKETFNDTLENSFLSISEDCRTEFGYVCSLNQLFSGCEICPESIGIKKNVFADIMNVVQDGLVDGLRLEVQKQLMSVLRNISICLPVTRFYDKRDLGIFSAKLYILSYVYAGELDRGKILAESAIRFFGITSDESYKIRKLASNDIDALEVLRNYRISDPPIPRTE